MPNTVHLLLDRIRLNLGYGKNPGVAVVMQQGL